MYKQKLSSNVLQSDFWELEIRTLTFENTYQQKLNSNMLAQSLAMATGSISSNPNKCFDGNRSLVYTKFNIMNKHMYRLVYVCVCVCVRVYALYHTRSISSNPNQCCDGNRSVV